jgi:hypothetical protein
LINPSKLSLDRAISAAAAAAAASSSTIGCPIYRSSFLLCKSLTATELNKKEKEKKKGGLFPE